MASPSEQTLIADRYRIGERLGAGSRGEVFSAVDTARERAVAIKMLHPVSADERRRVLREIAALRTLRMPGVVPLLDEGRHGTRHFIVMERIDGAPFPGPDATPTAVVTRVERLLQVLDRVHAAGIIHRDLKPANVLVAADGTVVVLDFGLARGASLGATMTASGAAVGTPRYQAPEQMRGLPLDSRSDLYAVGVMAFEALAGRPPHPASSLPELMRARLTQPAPSLTALAPDVPPPIAELVQSLLEREPADRPATAAEALAALSGDEGVVGWPWLGPRDPIQQVVDRLEQGRATRLGGPRRSGRSRCALEAAQCIASRGRRVFRLLAADRPFGSLAGLVDPSDLPGAGPLPDRVAAALRAHLLSGQVLVADDDIDRWTARVLVGQDGPLLQVVGPGAPADVRLGALGAVELEPLFAGPRRLFHLPQDAAAALFGRAGGLRADLIDELSTWIRDGVARREGHQLAVDRAALQRALSRPRSASGSVGELTGTLADVVAAAHLAWPDTTVDDLALALERPAWEIELALLELAEDGAVRRLDDGRWEPRLPASALPAWSESRLVGAHQRLAAALPTGSAGRLGHLLAGGDVDAIAAEAMVRAEQALAEGQCAEGLGIVQEALRAVRRETSHAEGASTAEITLGRAMIRLALEDNGAHLISEVAGQLRSLVRDARLTAELELLRAGSELRGREPHTAGTIAAGLAPFVDPHLELLRLTIRATAALYEGTGASQSVLDDVAPWFATRPPEVRARLASLRGNLLYRQSRFEEAAALHLEASRARATAQGRLACLANAGYALMEAFEFDRALDAAKTLVDSARTHRLSLLEAMGERVVRSVAYRTKTATEPDVALARASAQLEHVTLPALIALNEGAIAWRLGDLELARDLAGTAAGRAERSNQGAIVLAAQTLGYLAGQPASTAALERLAASAMAISLPRFAAQLLGAATRLHPRPPPVWSQTMDRLVATIPRHQRAFRLELLSLDEALNAS